MKLLSALLLSVAAQAANAGVPILMFHKVVPNTAAPAREAVQVGRFEEYLKMFKTEGYRTITVSELGHIIDSHQPIPTKTVVLTFDDGWKSTIDAVKLLEKYNQKATFYVMSGFFDDPAYLTKSEMVQLSKSKAVEIGSHTHTHFLKWEENLDTLETSTMIGEMVKSKVIIEKVIGKPVTSFAWPYGYVRPDAKSYAQYSTIVEVNPTSQNNHTTSVFQLQRLNIHGNCSAAQVKAMIDTGRLDPCK